MATLSPLMRPLRSRMVKASSSAWVGCSCRPSPALMIGDRQMRASRCAAPDDGWRSTIMLGPIASMLRAVSTSVSPLTTLELAMATPRVSALSRFSAISNDVRVRVEGSKNRLTTVRPRSAGTFLIGPLRDLLHRLGGVEDEQDLLGRQLGDAEQVLVTERRGRHGHFASGGLHDQASLSTVTSS